MELVNTKKKQKQVKHPILVNLRIQKNTKERILDEVERINKKELGKRIQPNDLISLSLSLLEEKHLRELQEASLSNADRLELDFRQYVSTNGPLSQDEYLGLRLSGKV